MQLANSINTKMKFSTVLLAQVLVWTAAAVVLPARDDVHVGDVMQARDAVEGELDVHLTARGVKAMQKELIAAKSKGVKAFTVPKPPAKGKKVTKRTSADAVADDLPRLERRINKEADMNMVNKGTSVDTVSTKGLATCSGIIVTFPGVTRGKIDKLVAHIGALNGQTAITKLTKEIYDAAVEGGVWNDDLDAGHRPEIYVSLPDVTAEVAGMVKDGTITKDQAAGMESTLRKVNTNVENSMQSVCSQMRGECHVKPRQGAQAVGSTMASTAAGAITIDGRPF